MAVEFNGEPTGGGNPLSRLPAWAWAVGIGGLVGIVFLLKKGGGSGGAGSPSNGVPLNAAVALGDLQSELLNQRGQSDQAVTQLGTNLSGKIDFAQQQLDASFAGQMKQQHELDALYNYVVNLGSSVNTQIGNTQQTLAAQNQDLWGRFWPYLLALMTHVGVTAQDFGPDWPGNGNTSGTGNGAAVPSSTGVGLGNTFGDPNHPATYDAGSGV
jgi:hypothetical protein